MKLTCVTHMVRTQALVSIIQPLPLFILFQTRWIADAVTHSLYHVMLLVKYFSFLSAGIYPVAGKVDSRCRHAQPLPRATPREVCALSTARAHEQVCACVWVCVCSMCVSVSVWVCVPFLPLEPTRQVCACVWVCVSVCVSVSVWVSALSTARVHEAGMCMCVCVCA